MGIAPESFTKLSQHIGYFPHRTNVGLVEASDGLYIIDSGDSDQDGKDIVKTCSNIFPEKKIKAIINTHSHLDHSGGNNYIIKNTGAQVWTSAKEAAILSNPDLMGVIYWGAICFKDLREQGFVPEKGNEVQRILTEGTIEIDSDISLKCISLPGHYFEQTGLLFYDKADGKSVFFLGDSCFGSQMLKKYWIPYMLDPVKFRESITKIENQDADFYVPGHGEVCDRKRISAITELNFMVTLETESLLLNILKKGPATHETLLRKAAEFAGFNLKLSQFVLIGTTFRSYLSSMADRGLVSYIIENNEMLWCLKS
ncbi:MAG: MBL fold metallo-hydrolase [Treponema sp.]|nr:MBL fold metallo-hydrolase [Treponema sp.]